MHTDIFLEEHIVLKNELTLAGFDCYSIDSFLDFIHPPEFYKQNVMFWVLGLLPSSGEKYLFVWVC
jgi:hypothetical protein